MDQEIILQTNKITETNIVDSYKDNGVFDFLSVDCAIELYKEIHTNGIPKLDWKFYGRKKPGKQSQEKATDLEADNNEATNTENIAQEDDNNPTAFDFDEEFNDTTATIDNSLQLKKRPDKDSEKKTNLSDIMSDILKESHTETILEASIIDENKESSIDETNNMLEAIEEIKSNLQAVPEEEEEFMDTREQIEEELKELKEQQY